VDRHLFEDTALDDALLEAELSFLDQPLDEALDETQRLLGGLDQQLLDVV